MEDLENNITINFPVGLVELEPNSTEQQLEEHLRFLMTIVPIVVPVLFTLVIVIGFIGNLLVVLVVVLNKTMRNTTNILIFNLAVKNLNFSQHVQEIIRFIGLIFSPSSLFLLFLLFFTIFNSLLVSDTSGPKHVPVRRCFPCLASVNIGICY